MPTLLGGIGIAVSIAVFGAGALYLSQTPVYRSQPMDSVRVGDPGYNLVGQNWSGNPQGASER